MRVTWDLSTDVVVVGFGAAGAAASIEAAAGGADVLALDRYEGGGTSTISGGVVYAGGGTSIQRRAGIEDSPDQMYAYLEKEVGDAVSPATLRRFCEDSPAMIDWLADHGVPFEASLCPYKTPIRATSTTCTTPGARRPVNSVQLPPRRLGGIGRRAGAHPGRCSSGRSRPRLGRRGRGLSRRPARSH